MMNEVINQLESERRDTIKILNGINKRIQEHKRDVELPALKKQYEGKFFVAPNSYGSGSNWKVYTLVKEVIDTNEAIVFQFQTDSHGESRFSSGHSFISTYCEKKISETSFMKAFWAFQQKLTDSLVNPL